MIRTILRLTAAAALVSLVPGIPRAAASPGLAYDEIVRVVVGTATPPPPGNFAADVAALQSPAPVAATPAPRKHGFGNLGALAGNILSGNVSGAVSGVAGDAADSAMEAQTDRMLAPMMGTFASALRGLTQGRLERHSFYSGWERVDDVAGQTATITKCDLRQIIKLDLAKKTYSITDPTAVSSQPSAPEPKHARGIDATPAPQQPGTAVAEFSNVVTPLKPVRIDGNDTSGYDSSTTFAMTQATGSCRDGTFAFKTRTYYSRYPTPRLVCPLPPAQVPPQRYPQEPSNFVAQGGCRPTFTARKSGPQPPSGYLSLYQTMASFAGAATPSPAGSPAPGFVFLTERGNLRSLTAADESLFEIPPGFTKVP